MKYERPEMELVVLQTVDVITVSSTEDNKDEKSILTPDNW